MNGISVKVKYCPSSVRQGEGTLHYRLVQSRTAVQLTTGCRIAAVEWSEKKSCVLLPGRESPRYMQLSAIRNRISWGVRQIARIANSGEGMTAAEVLDKFSELDSRQSFFRFMGREIERLNQAGRVRTAETYRSALQSFVRFRQGHDIMLYEFTAEVAEAYQRHLVSKRVSMNTVSFYMRILRATFNKAVRQRLVPPPHPFGGVYTGVAPTLKRTVGVEDIRRIKALCLDSQPRLAFARDLFLFSFYCRGMSFVDMAYLRKSCLRHGYLEYTRRKTGQRLAIKWEVQMQQIVDRYRQASPYLLPILHLSAPEAERHEYMRMNKQLNRWLKRVGEMAGIPSPLTMYRARHSWASIAKQRNHPLGIICQALGHTSERTTQIYLASLDNKVVDDANSDILSVLK